MADVSVREQLLEAAISAIDAKGEACVRIDELLKEVGVTAPSLYHHFGNREGLILVAQVERFARAFKQDFPPFIDAVKASTTLEELKASVQIAFRMREESTRATVRMKRISALGAAYMRPELAEQIVDIHEELVQRIVDALRPFQENGMIRSDIDLNAVVAWYNCAVLGRVLIEIAPSTIDTNNWAAVMADAMDHVLFGN